MATRRSAAGSARGAGARTAAADPMAAPGRGAVKRVLVIADLGKQGVRDLRVELVPWLEARVEKVEVEGDLIALCRARAELSDADVARDLPDVVIVLGGDGAILGAVRAFARAPVPTLGVNFGRVGFLASTPAKHWKDALEGVLGGAGVVEPRMRLEARLTPRGGREIGAVALNDVLVARGGPEGMLALALSVGEHWVTDYRADGLIVATPSGSTAHSVSAGGPVLFPSMLAIAVTPICPQGLSYRPIVMHPDSRLEIVVRETSGDTAVVVDGRALHPLLPGDVLRVARHPVAYPLLAWPKLDPYRRLRDRLGWSEPRYKNAE